MAGGSGRPAEEELWSRAGQRGVAAARWPPGREDVVRPVAVTGAMGHDDSAMAQARKTAVCPVLVTGRRGLHNSGHGLGRRQFSPWWSWERREEGNGERRRLLVVDNPEVYVSSKNLS
jgi:hypothetical protein